MAQDIRKLFEQEREGVKPTLSDGHEARFLQKLEKKLPQKSKRRVMLPWRQIVAASVLLFIVAWAGYYALRQSPTDIVQNPAIVNDVSPIEIKPEQKEENIAQVPIDSSKMNVSPVTKKEKPLLRLSDLSPDLKKVETYFISSINVELASLEVTEDEKEMVSAYLTKVKELGKEYEELNKELNTIGANEMTITALIENLKIRLQLLQRLKKNLNHSKKERHEKDSSGNI